MSRSRIHVLVINLVLTVLVPLILGARSFRDFLTGFAVISFFVALLEIVLGALFAVFSKAQTPGRETGTTMLLVGAVLLLTSFTLCSSGAVNFLQ